MEFLNTLSETSAKRHRKISRGKYVWRAQVGYSTAEREMDEITYEEEIPFPKERMKPLRDSAQEGRVNPRGIPCLYVATDKQTAMSEVRPWLDTYISIGQMRIERDLTLVDFSVGHNESGYVYLEEPTPEERERAVWYHVDRAFSVPVTSDPSVAEYAPTQVIAEFFRKKGFDGLVYKSNLGPGFNIALFDLTSAELVSYALSRVKAVQFEFDELKNGYHVHTDA